MLSECLLRWLFHFKAFSAYDPMLDCHIPGKEVEGKRVCARVTMTRVLPAHAQFEYA
jgi:hypothetical protein